MLVALLLCEKDCALACDLLKWIGELGGCRNHDLLIVADAGTAFTGIVEAKTIAESCFRSVDVITNGTSVIGWVEGPKSLVLTMFRYLAEKNMAALMLDSDAIPLVPEWLDLIAKEYQTCGKSYMGHVFQCDQPGLPTLLMSPIAVYPPTAIELIPLIEKGHHWDVSMTPGVIRKCHNTKLIQHLFGEINNPPTFAPKAIPGTSTFAIESINPGVVVFHRNKDGTLIRLLRERRTGKIEVQPNRTHAAKVFFQMGRYGDLILLLPAFREWAYRTGEQTIVVTSKEFGDVLDGVSYVKPIKLPHNWHLQTGEALNFARRMYPDIIRIQLHGVGMEPAVPDTLPSFSLSMWNRTGLLPQYHTLPLIFDRRSKEREAALIKRWVKPERKTLLVNFHGRTSPFADREQFIAVLCQRLGGKFEFVNTNEVQAHRIYDLLGLMDVAAGMITVDTATLHLAPASRMPYVALVRPDGQSGSVPKGNIKLTVGYNQAIHRVQEICDVMEQWA